MHTHTEPPSAPQNLAVVNFTNISVYLTWEPPESTGGRDDIEYELSYNRSDGSGDRIVHGRVATTEGEISGLTPFTEYVVYVNVENGVSSQAPDASERTVTTTVMTEEGGQCYSPTIDLHIQPYSESCLCMSVLT